MYIYFFIFPTVRMLDKCIWILADSSNCGEVVNWIDIGYANSTEFNYTDDKSIQNLCSPVSVFCTN